VADGGSDFEVDGSNLGQGKEETTLTDGAKDPVSNAGANISLDKIQFLNWMITDEDELKIEKNYSRIEKNCLEKGRLYASDIERYNDFLQKRDDEKGIKDIKEKPSLFYDVS
jgi:hypothetical protein